MSFDVFVLLLTHTVTELKHEVFEPLDGYVFIHLYAIPDSEVSSLVQSTAVSFKSPPPPPFLLFFVIFCFL